MKLIGYDMAGRKVIDIHADYGRSTQDHKGLLFYLEGEPEPIARLFMGTTRNPATITTWDPRECVAETRKVSGFSSLTLAADEAENPVRIPEPPENFPQGRFQENRTD